MSDDDLDVLLLSATLLREQGYEVYEATTGRECLEATRAHRPDMILLDVMLPDMTGVEVCRQIKNDEELRRAFVILVSGVRVSSEYQADGLNVGADGYMIKDMTNREFLARVSSMVRIKRVEDALRKRKRSSRN